VLADLPEDDPAVVEEIFGPVLTVRAAEDADDLLRLANGVPHALAASVWSERAPGALRLAGALNAGEVWVNCHLEQTAKLPHGGRAESGHGTDLSVLALTEYQRPKTITVSSGGDQGRLPTAAPAQLADRRPARVHQQCRGDHRVRLRPADPVRPARRPPVVGDLHGRAAARAALDRAAHPVRAGRARSRPGRGWKAGSTG
jgi:Aldehyde dehydrogenase family